MITCSKGFMLMQVVIGTMIASVISIILMNALGQMTKISQLVDDMHKRTFQLMMIHHQFERDILGMCVPLQGTIKEEKKTTADDKNSSAEKNTAQKPTLSSAQQKPIKKVFFAAVNNTQMQQLTFITNNPVPRYWQGTVGSANPKIVRVVYYLQPNTEHPESFTLMRQESTDLHMITFGKDAPVKAYAVADNIQSFSLTFSYQTVQEGDKKTASPKTQSAQVNHWNSDELLTAGKKDDAKKYASLLPRSITIAGTLWNQTYTKTVPFSLTIPILAEGFNAPLVHETKKDEKKQTPQAPQEQQQPKPAALEVTSMQEAIKALGGNTEGNIMVMSDKPKKGMHHHSFSAQAPVVQIPFDHIIIGNS